VLQNELCEICGNDDLPLVKFRNGETGGCVICEMMNASKTPIPGKLTYNEETDMYYDEHGLVEKIELQELTLRTRSDYVKWYHS